MNEPSRTIGEVATYTVTLPLPKDLNFYDTTVVDELPAGVALLQSAPHQVSCQIDGVPCDGTAPGDSFPFDYDEAERTLTWQFGEISGAAAERTLILSYSVLVLDDSDNVNHGDSLENAVELSWNTASDGSGTPLKSTAESTFTIAEPDLSIAKTVSDPTPAPDQEFTYTVTVTNTGDAAAHDVTVVDALPTGISITGQISDSGTHSNGEITWEIAQIAASHSVELTYKAKLVSPSPAASPAQENTARVAQYYSLDTDHEAQDDPSREYQGDTAIVQVNPALPHVSVEKATADGNYLAYRGEPKAFTFTITSDGHSTAHDVGATDTLPEQWTYAGDATITKVKIDDSQEPITPSGPTQTTENNQVVLDWAAIGDLKVGEKFIVTYSAIPSHDAAVGHTHPHTNTVAVVAHDALGQTKDAADTPFQGPSAEASVFIDSADIGITKDPVGTPVAGQDFSWDIVVSNHGDDPSVGPFVMTDDLSGLPAGVSFKSITTTGTLDGHSWSCEATPDSNEEISCTFADGDFVLDPISDSTGNGGVLPTITLTVAIDADVDAGQPIYASTATAITNAALVDGFKTHDPDLDKPDSNNKTTNTVDVSREADLGIVKKLATSLVAGENATYELEVTNHGPSHHTGKITVTDTLPAGVEFVSIGDDQDPHQWACASAPNDDREITCVFGTDTTDVPVEDGSGAGKLPTITVVVHVPADYAGETVDPVTNTATVVGTTPEPEEDPDNPNQPNESTVTNTPDTAAALTITKEAAAQSVLAGESTSYSLEVTNSGPSDARNVVVTDELPDGFTLASTTADAGWSCSEDSATPQVVTCNLDLLAANASTTIELLVDVAADRDAEEGVKNTAKVSSTDSDEDEDSDTIDVIREADVWIEKSHSEPALDGQNIDFTLQVGNNGPSSATNVVVVDELPANLEFVAATNNADWDCTETDQIITCAYLADDGVLAPASAATPGAPPVPTITITAKIVNAEAFTTIENTATITAAEEDPQEGNNSSTDPVIIGDGELVKATATPERTIGQRAQYSVTATLPAQLDLYNVTIIDTLPVGLDPSSVQLTECTVDGITCADTPVPLDRGGATIGWLIGNLSKTADAQSQTVTLTYTALVQDIATNQAGDTLVNSAYAAWRFGDGDTPQSVNEVRDPDSDYTTTGPKTARVTITEPNLGIVKKVNNKDQDTVIPGQEFEYALTVTNTGDAAAHRVTVVDELPAGVSPVAGSISHDGQLAGNTITWTLADPLPPGTAHAVELTYKAKLASPAPTAPQTNTATISQYYSGDGEEARTYDEDYYRDVYESGLPSDSAEVDVALPQVSAEKAALVNGDPTDDTIAYIGEPVTWQITAQSDSDVPAHNIIITDELPAGWSYVAGSAKVSVLGAEPIEQEPTIDGQKLTWQGTPDGWDLLENTDTITVTFATQADETIVTGSDHAHINIATIAAHDAEGESTNRDDEPYGDTDNATARVHQADLEIIKTADQATPIPGQEFTWTLTVTNNGTDQAVGPFQVTDSLPAGFVAPISVSGTDWTCSGTDPIECTYDGTLDKGKSLPVITVTATVADDVAPGDKLTNTATVSGKTHDHKPGNNTGTSTITPEPRADMGIVKKLSGPITAGEVATYTLDVTNHGPSTHWGPLTVTDQVPAGTTFKSATGNGWDCALDGDTVVCTHDDTTHAVGALGQITLKLLVDADQQAAITNTASVEGDGPDGTPEPKPEDKENNTSSTTNTPDQSADLSINKTSLDLPWVAGTNNTYQFTIHNDGPSVARGVYFTDTLPAGTSFVSFAGADWNCAVDGADELRCDYTKPQQPDTDQVVTVTVHVDDDHVGDLENSATVDSDTPDPVEENNTDTDHTDGTEEADLVMVKEQVEDNPVIAGETVTYRLTITNDGPSVARAPITVTDQLPDGLSCAAINGEPCVGSEIELVRHQDLGVGQSFTVTVRAAIAADAGPATVRNHAVVDSPTESDPTNNADSTTTDIVDRANITLTKTGATAPVRAGTTTNFTLSVHNEGPSDADNIVVTDTLPAGMSIVSIDGPGWNCDQTTLVCDRAVLAAGATAEITVTAAVDSAVADGSQLTNIAQASTSTDGDDPADNRDTHAVDVIAVADLKLVKTHLGDGVVAAGTDTTYRLQVTNRGPSDAVGPIRVTDTLPAGFSFLAANAPWECDATGAAISCLLDDDLQAGTAAPALKMTVHVDADADEREAALNAAGVTSSTFDDDLDNNNSSVPVKVQRTTNISITKTHTQQARVGDELEFTLQVNNAGPASARKVKVTDTMPTGLTFVSAEGGADWTCGFADRQLTCEHDGPLGPDADATPVVVTTKVTAKAYPGVDNVAEVSTTTPDRNPDDNIVTDEVVVPPLADLAIEKEAIGNFKVGRESTFTLTVTNNGPTPTGGPVTVTDVLPTTMELLSAKGDGWDCKLEGQRLTCLTDELGVGDTSVITLKVKPLPKAYPSVTNTAVVKSDAEDPEPDNNSSSTKVTVYPDVRLVLDKELVELDGNRATYELTVTNIGANDTVTDVVAVDSLPQGLELVSTSGKGWKCSVAKKVVTCTATKPIKAGASSTVTVVTNVVAAPGESVRNHAQVDGGAVQIPGEDPEAERNQIKRPDGSKGPADIDRVTFQVPPADEVPELPKVGGPSSLWLTVGSGALLAGLILLAVSRRRGRAGN